MNELWIRFDEGWMYYDAKPMYEALELTDLPVDARKVFLDDKQLVEYLEVEKQHKKWQDFFEKKYREKKK